MAYDDIHKLIHAKKTKFEAGVTGLQSYRARAIQSYLKMVVDNGRLSVEASERAAESQGFAARWGGRRVRKWSRDWVAFRALPVSKRGHHSKVYSLLDDPKIKAELRAYVRSNKWAMNPGKLAEFAKGNMLPAAADKYLRDVVQSEMPKGLKKYMDLELFPRIENSDEARHWLRKEGFRYISYKKGFYFDGHDRPDVVKYRQEEFLPIMKFHARRLIRFVIGDVDKEDLSIPPENYVERRLVLCVHDEMTAQAHDSPVKSWVFEDQHSLRKKGAGRGIHQSNIICSTIREKIIPAFEAAHGAGHEDALLASRMNISQRGCERFFLSVDYQSNAFEENVKNANLTLLTVAASELSSNKPISRNSDH
ncbi:hypothetical protein K443DRAFT_122247 [Laccaria amethystina LaAM-08-1]|uniref:Uncharacterized protein n=1 Tax=Laccaria amethystina LaAM-08-1 TaxID=1095629 RepID=A0A0C9X9S8_9AGAR|nr:hypothetical protein K443DRAFT_122247 [Laccaria amethystina LaAM-08-1]